MYNELPIRTPLGNFSAFLQRGFYHGIALSPFHNHNYTEVHLLLDGFADFVIEGKKHAIGSGHMLILPKKTLHSCVRQDVGTKHSAFQISYDLPEGFSPSFLVVPVDEQLLRRILDEIRRCRETDDHKMISAYLALLCCYFREDEELKSNRVVNYGFAIHEFFLTRYTEDVRLSDLAETLHLSERQTERLVRQYMGETFRRTLAATRRMIARQLIDFSEFSMTEIAEYVGYRSYAGFWKAIKGDHSDPADF